MWFLRIINFFIGVLCGSNIALYFSAYFLLYARDIKCRVYALTVERRLSERRELRHFSFFLPPIQIAPASICVCVCVCLSGTGWMDGWMEWDGRRRMTTASDGWMTPRRISAGESVPAKPPPASRTQKRDSAELKRRITLLLCCCK